MIETREKEIDGVIYSVTQLPARRALRLKAKIIRIFGPAISQMVLTMTDPSEKDIEKMSEDEKKAYQKYVPDNAVDAVRIEDIKRSSIVKSMQLLASNIDDKTFDEVCSDILVGVRSNGVELTPALIDSSFAGKIVNLYLLILFALEVNFGDFFSMLPGIGNQSANPREAATDTSKTYTYQ